MQLVYMCHMHRCLFVCRHRKTHKPDWYELLLTGEKRKWKRSDADALQTPQNDRKCKSKLHKDDTKTFN